MLEWFSTKSAETFGAELAKLVIEHVPSGQDLNEAKRQSKTNYSKERLLKRIRQFRQAESLNFYKTAKLLNTFKWDLKDAGYDDSFVDSMTSWVLLSLRS